MKYNAYSIHHFDKKLFLGLKNNLDSCLLIEYELNNNYNDEINMGKGYDKCFEISSIYELNENKIVTCNKNNFIKIWKESESKPKNLFFDNNPNFYKEDDYESDNELELNNYNIIESQKKFGKNGTPIDLNPQINENNIPEGKGEKLNEENKIQENETPGNKIEINNDINFLESQNIYNNNNNHSSINIQDEQNEQNDFSSFFLLPKESINTNKIDIYFNLSFGLKIVLNFEKTITVEEMIQIFCEKMNYDNKIIDESLAFIYHAEKLNINDKRKIGEVFLGNQNVITVFDPKYILDNNIINLKTARGKEYKMIISPKENMNNLIKKYFEKTGKLIQDKNIDFLKEVSFEDFIISLSDFN